MAGINDKSQIKRMMPGRMEHSGGAGRRRQLACPPCRSSALPYLAEAWQGMEPFSSFRNERGMAAIRRAMSVATNHKRQALKQILW